MSKGRQKFCRSDIMRAAKAVTDSGLIISGVRISPQGEIVIETNSIKQQDSAGDLDRWLGKKEARHACPPKGH